MCASPYRRIYEKKKLEGASLRQLQKLAEAFGEKINKDTFNRHFKLHGMIVTEKPESKEEESIRILDEITENLKALRSLVNRMLSDPTLLSEPQKITALKNLLTEIRLSLNTLFQMRQKLEVKPVASKDELVQLMLELMSDMEEDVIVALRKKLALVMHT